MYLLYVGLTHKKAPIHIREAIHFNEDTLISALHQLKQEKSILENIILSTCNRTELYLVVDQIHTGKYYAKNFLAKYFNINLMDLESYLDIKEQDEVLEHLLKVSVGLESKIIGETQILGQLKRAYEIAHSQKTTGIILNYIFREVVTFAKSMHDIYKINDRPTSVSFAAVQVLDNLNRNYEKETVVIIGLGEIGKLVSKYILEKNPKKIIYVNRTIGKAYPLLRENCDEVYPFSQLSIALKKATIVFSAIKSDGYIIKPNEITNNTILFDLSVPRTIHPLSHAILYDIDTLSDKLSHFQNERLKLAEKIVQHIYEEIENFHIWQSQLGIVPLIKELREKSLLAQKQALSSLENKLPNLTEREKLQIQKHMKSIVNQILKEPILQLKEMSIGENSSYDIALIAKIFGLTMSKDDIDEN